MGMFHIIYYSNIAPLKITVEVLCSQSNQGVFFVCLVLVFGFFSQIEFEFMKRQAVSPKQDFVVGICFRMRETTHGIDFLG